MKSRRKERPSGSSLPPRGGVQEFKQQRAAGEGPRARWGDIVREEPGLLSPETQRTRCPASYPTGNNLTYRTRYWTCGPEGTHTLPDSTKC